MINEGVHSGGGNSPCRLVSQDEFSNGFNGPVEESAVDISVEVTGDHATGQVHLCHPGKGPRSPPVRWPVRSLLPGLHLWSGVWLHQIWMEKIFPHERGSL